MAETSPPQLVSLVAADPNEVVPVGPLKLSGSASVIEKSISFIVEETGVAKKTSKLVIEESHKISNSLHEKLSPSSSDENKNIEFTGFELNSLITFVNDAKEVLTSSSNSLEQCRTFNRCSQVIRSCINRLEKWRKRLLNFATT